MMQRISKLHKIHQGGRLSTIIIFFIAGLLGTSMVSAQNYRSTQGDILVLGTANTRSWSLQTNELDCEATIDGSKGNLKISSLKFNVEVKKLKGQNIWMNRGVYKALKSYPFKNITYRGVFFKTRKVNENTYNFAIEGNLIIAGRTQVIPLTVKAVIDGKGNIICTGSTVIKMSDFNVMLHQTEQKRLDVGDEVILSFAIELNPYQNVTM